MMLRVFLRNQSAPHEVPVFSTAPLSLHNAKYVMFKIKSYSSFHFLLKNINMIFVFVYALWGLLYAYIFSLPVFLWSVACLLLNIPWDARQQFLVRYYCGLLLLSEYVLSMFHISVFWDIDASLHSGVSIAVRLFLLGILRILKFFKGLDGSDTLSRRSFSLAHEAKEEPKKSEQLSRWKKFKIISVFMFTNIKNFCLSIFFIISIGGIFFCSLQDVNLLNATYHAYFLVFLIFPKFARKAWKSLLAYTAAVISSQLIWSVIGFRRLIDPSLSKVIGLSNLNGFHVIIYVMSSIQLKAYEISSEASEKKENNPPISNETELETTMKLRRIFRTFFEFLQYSVHHFWIFISFFFLTLPFLKAKKVTLIDTGYLIIAFIYFLLSGFNLPQFKLVLWFIAIGYTGTTIIVFYIYQVSKFLLF
jgi:hypothetical protein